MSSDQSKAPLAAGCQTLSNITLPYIYSAIFLSVSAAGAIKCQAAVSACAQQRCCHTCTFRTVVVHQCDDCRCSHQHMLLQHIKIPILHYYNEGKDNNSNQHTAVGGRGEAGGHLSVYASLCPPSGAKGQGQLGAVEKADLLDRVCWFQNDCPLI